jgi:hypothetical protein
MHPQIADVIRAFKKPGEKDQAILIEQLTALGIAGRDILIQVWNDSASIEAKRWAISGLGNYNDSQSRKIIQSSLLNKAMSIRLHGIRAINMIGNKRLGIDLIPLIDDESGGIRINALDVIVGLRVSGWKTIVNKCLTDQKMYVRKRAQFYLSTYTV